MGRLSAEQLEAKRAAIRDRVAPAQKFQDRVAAARAEAHAAFKGTQQEPGEDVMDAVAQQNNLDEAPTPSPSIPQEAPKRRGRPPKAEQPQQPNQGSPLITIISGAAEHFRAMGYDDDGATRLVLAYAMLECGVAVSDGLKGLRQGLLAVNATLAASQAES